MCVAPPSPPSPGAVRGTGVTGGGGKIGSSGPALALGGSVNGFRASALHVEGPRLNPG